jgi:hypothetical protein
MQNNLNPDIIMSNDDLSVGADTNVDNYSIEELLAILELDDPNEQDIVDVSNSYIQRFQYEQPNTVFASFFTNIQRKLVQYIRDIKTQIVQQASGAPVLVTPASRDIGIPNPRDHMDEDAEVYGEGPMPMSRKTVPVNNVFDTKIAQDKLNPNLENVTSRVIVLDSQYRQMDGSVSASSTDYTADLSETLNNVISLRLFSIQIPFTWYLIDVAYGNTCMWVTNSGNTFLVEIDSGNYSASDLCVALNAAFVQAGFVVSSASGVATYSASSGKVTLSLGGTVDPSGNIIYGIAEGANAEPSSPYITFFDFSRKLKCKEGCASATLCFDRSLGWTLGFRLHTFPIYSTGNVGTAVVNVSGPKYFILILDDFNQNHINNGVVNIAEYSSRLSLPSYYSPDYPITCVPNVGGVDELSALQAKALGVNINNLAGLVLDNTYISTTVTPVMLPSAPRTLTQAQIYTINEIIKNREKSISYRGKPPSSSDALAIIPLKVNGLRFGDVYVELGGSLQDNKRIYFGPVNIERMRVRLVDDKGYTVNLNGGDWAFTLISENLYQY